MHQGKLWKTTTVCFWCRSKEQLVIFTAMYGLRFSCAAETRNLIILHADATPLGGFQLYYRGPHRLQVAWLFASFLGSDERVENEDLGVNDTSEPVRPV